VNFAGDGDVAWTPTAGPACRDLETAREPSHGSRACAPDVYPLRSCPRRRRGQGPSRRARPGQRKHCCASLEMWPKM
jgi:hypothetical protein